MVDQLCFVNIFIHLWDKQILISPTNPKRLSMSQTIFWRSVWRLPMVVAQSVTKLAAFSGPPHLTIRRVCLGSLSVTRSTVISSSIFFLKGPRAVQKRNRSDMRSWSKKTKARKLFWPHCNYNLTWPNLSKNNGKTPKVGVLPQKTKVDPAFELCFDQCLLERPCLWGHIGCWVSRQC